VGEVRDRVNWLIMSFPEAVGFADRFGFAFILETFKFKTSNKIDLKCN
jgi:hypothetical protein